ncbi:MAG: RagB/SusD family nutrient uptake outer membrane protein, partial [Prevotellaceae bacterium]|nr:RagB/SusD family nutrient uptake outer membrane protein [Prevotellaceae bacterium]
PAGLFTSGWGWAPVQEGAYAIFNETGDRRKEASVNAWAEGEYSPGYQNTGLFLRKYAARVGYNDNKTGDAALNYENNMRIYRLAETYLNAAELAFATGGQGAAQPFLDAIRERAFGDNAHAIPATLNNIKLERRRELFGEGHRFWDLVRWGSDETGRSIEQTLSVNDPDHNLVRTYTADKRFLPIPKDEIDKTKGTEFELQQNPGWE